MCRGGFNLLQQINQCVTHNEYNWIWISISHSTSIWSSRTTALSVNTHRLLSVTLIKQVGLIWLTTEERNRKSGKYKDNGMQKGGGKLKDTCTCMLYVRTCTLPACLQAAHASKEQSQVRICNTYSGQPPNDAEVHNHIRYFPLMRKENQIYVALL